MHQASCRLTLLHLWCLHHGTKRSILPPLNTRQRIARCTAPNTTRCCRLVLVGPVCGGACSPARQAEPGSGSLHPQSTEQGAHLQPAVLPAPDPPLHVCHLPGLPSGLMQACSLVMYLVSRPYLCRIAFPKHTHLSGHKIAGCGAWPGSTWCGDAISCWCARQLPALRAGRSTASLLQGLGLLLASLNVQSSHEAPLKRM